MHLYLGLGIQTVVTVYRFDQLLTFRIRYVLRGWCWLSNKLGYLAPYKSCRHHLRNYKSRVRAHAAKEISNHAHSLLGNIIRRRFGVLKACFSILKRTDPYSLTQVIIVIAAVTLYNYIRQENPEELVIW